MTSFERIGKAIAFLLAIALIVGIFSGVLLAFVGIVGSGDSGSSQIAEDENGMRTETFNQAIESLEIEVLSTDINIIQGKTLNVQYDKSTVKVKTKNNTLIVDEKGQAALSKDKAPVTVTLPKGYTFSAVEIEAGANKLTISYLLCDNLTVDTGAGEMMASGVTVSGKADFDCGVGKVTISDSKLSNLYLDCGVGDCTVSATLSGNSQIDCGVGKTDIELLGKKDSYTVSATKGVGIIKVDGKLVRDGSTTGDGDNRVSIDGGVGTVVVSFAS